MQPYFLPYIGYFQLIASVDKFIVYDDVSFIKGGWINRNNIKVQGEANMMTIPLRNGRSGVPICDVLIAGKREYWTKKILRTVSESYSKAPFYGQIFPMFDRWMALGVAGISELNVQIVRDICDYLELEVVILPTSAIYGNTKLKSVDRVLDICRIEGANVYINAIGGMALYSNCFFGEKGIDLYFLKPELDVYPQGRSDFIAGLSILDVLMWNSKKTVQRMLNNYTLVS